MKKHIIRALFALLGTAAAILPLLHAPEAQPEYTYGCEMDFRRSREDQLLYFYSSDGIAAQLSAPRYDGYWVDFSLTRASALAIPDCDFDSGGTLYYIDRSGAMPIAEGVHHAIASDCESGAYITELDADRRLGKLNYFRNGKSSCIESRLCTRLNFGLHISPAISPDGKTLAYSRDNGSGGITGMLYHNGKYIELGEDIFPIAVSDNAEYLYYGRLSVPAAETSLETLMPPTDYYVRCGKTDTLIGQGSYAYFLFNRDFSEAIVTADSFSMISAEGGGRLRPFSGHYPTGVLAPQAGLAVEASYGAASAYSTMYTRVGADSFIGKVLHSEWGGFAHDVCMGTKCPYHKTLYLDEQLQMHIITDGSYSLQIAEEGHAALYSLGHELYLIPDVRNYSPDRDILISKYCKNFTGNSDFSTVYYTNTADTLYSYSAGELTLLAQDVHLHTPSVNSYLTVYGSAITPSRFNGSIYFRKNTDRSLWHISPEGSIGQVFGLPEGVWTLALGGELLFRTAAGIHSEFIDFYRLAGDNYVKIMSLPAAT